MTVKIINPDGEDALRLIALTVHRVRKFLVKTKNPEVPQHMQALALAVMVEKYVQSLEPRSRMAFESMVGSVTTVIYSTTLPIIEQTSNEALDEKKEEIK